MLSRKKEITTASRLESSVHSQKAGFGSCALAHSLLFGNNFCSVCVQQQPALFASTPGSLLHLYDKCFYFIFHFYCILPCHDGTHRERMGPQRGRRRTKSKLHIIPDEENCSQQKAKLKTTVAVLTSCALSILFLHYCTVRVLYIQRFFAKNT